MGVRAPRPAAVADVNCCCRDTRHVGEVNAPGAGWRRTVAPSFQRVLSLQAGSGGSIYSTGLDSPLDEHSQLPTKHEVLGADRLIRTRQQHRPPQGVYEQARHDSSERHHGLSVPRTSVPAKRLRGRAMDRTIVRTAVAATQACGEPWVIARCELDRPELRSSVDSARRTPLIDDPNLFPWNFNNVSR